MAAVSVTTASPWRNAGTLPIGLMAEIGGPFHRRGIVEHFGFVRLTDFLKHPADDAAAGLRIGVEHQFVGHVVYPLCDGHAAIWNAK